jgi:hypothetical protein
MEPRAPAGTARTGVLVFAAVVTQIVIIGAACNQWVTERIGNQILRSALNNGSPTVRDFKQSLIAFNWRYAPRSFDHQHIWLGQILMILTLLVVSAAVISLVTRGPITFGRAFVGSWAAVVFATVLASYVRGLVNEGNTSSSPRITKALFEQAGQNTPTIFAGVVLGLATGLIVGAVAVQTRRPATPERAAEAGEEPYSAPEQPPAFFGTTPLPPWQDQHYGPPARHAAPPPATAQPDQPSTAFPRPPDDDDLGHVPQ